MINCTITFFLGETRFLSGCGSSTSSSSSSSLSPSSRLPCSSLSLPSWLSCSSASLPSLLSFSSMSLPSRLSFSSSSTGCCSSSASSLWLFSACFSVSSTPSFSDDSEDDLTWIFLTFLGDFFRFSLSFSSSSDESGGWWRFSKKNQNNNTRISFGCGQCYRCDGSDEVVWEGVSEEGEEILLILNFHFSKRFFLHIATF